MASHDEPRPGAADQSDGGADSGAPDSNPTAT